MLEPGPARFNGRIVDSMAYDCQYRRLILKFDG